MWLSKVVGSTMRLALALSSGAMTWMAWYMRIGKWMAVSCLTQSTSLLSWVVVDEEVLLTAIIVLSCFMTSCACFVAWLGFAIKKMATPAITQTNAKKNQIRTVGFFFWRLWRWLRFSIM